MEVKTVGIACDHAGFPLKQFVLEYLEKKGYPCLLYTSAKQLDPEKAQANWGYTRYQAYYGYYGPNAPETKQAEACLLYTSLTITLLAHYHHGFLLRIVDNNQTYYSIITLIEAHTTNTGRCTAPVSYTHLEA